MEKEFADRDDVKIWIIQNQFGRRNINNYVRSKLALELEGLFQKKAKANSELAGKLYGENHPKKEPLEISPNPLDMESKIKRGEIEIVKIIPTNTRAEASIIFF